MSDDSTIPRGGKPSPLHHVEPAARTMIARTGGERPEPPPDPARGAGRQDGRQHPAATPNGRPRAAAVADESYDDYGPPPEDSEGGRNGESYPDRGAHNAPPITQGEASRGGAAGVTRTPFRGLR